MNQNLLKTLMCVALAGLLFFIAVLYDLPLLVVIGAFFDWLPLPTRWMQVDETSGVHINHGAVKIHLILTLIAYLFAIVWVLMGFAVITLPVDAAVIKTLFIEIWWLAVITGQIVYLPE